MVTFESLNHTDGNLCIMGDKKSPTRKPRPVSQLVVQQVNQQYAPPPTLLKKEKKERSEKSDKELTLRKKSLKKMRPRLKNVDRSSAQHLEVTVGDLTVIITDFKEKAKPMSTSTSAAAGDPHNQSGSSSDNTERGVSRCSSPRGDGSSVNGDAH
ncbi:YY1-associated factor 2 isoform X2 [Syngnathus scovelli]|uniref:YY1-associated factor 2 isoform X2 n=1 Tax=Syngnathus scovelli TaxID=161590 RepID=UPI00210F4F74|nr:YY1-associated factor 2 isoform X2 [Syngnathus scovelli]